MDFIPFQKVTVDEAKAARDEPPAGIAAAPEPAKERSPDREPGVKSAVKVNKAVMAWLSQLPPEVRPRRLAIEYPHIFNKIAELWSYPLRCEDLLNELLIDDRCTRSGFPPEVAQELVALNMHFIKTSRTVHYGVWGERIGE